MPERRVNRRLMIFMDQSKNLRYNTKTFPASKNMGEAADEQRGNQSIMRILSIITLLFLAGAILSAEAVFVNAPNAADKPPAGRAVETERRGERLKRFLQRTLDDLKESQALAEEDISELDKQVEAVTPLESSRREADFQSLID
jgi:hypothetical protein